MKSWFVRIVVTVAVINLIFYSVPSFFVMFGSDISIFVLFEQGSPLHIALWIHRYSVLSLLAIFIAVIALLSRIRFGSVFAALVIAVFFVDMVYLANFDGNPQTSGPLPRLEYDNEEFGRNAEELWKYVMIVFQLLLIAVLVFSKRMKQVYVLRAHES
jgi:hypothetical protein